MDFKRNYSDEGHYSFVNTDISKHSNDGYITQNPEYNIEYNANCVLIGSASEVFKIGLPQLTEMSYDSSVESVCYYVGDNDNITVKPCLKREVNNYRYTKAHKNKKKCSEIYKPTINQ